FFCFFRFRAHPTIYSFSLTTLFRSRLELHHELLHHLMDHRHRQRTERDDRVKAVTKLRREQPVDRLNVVAFAPGRAETDRRLLQDRKSTRLNSSHVKISYAVFCLKK